MKVNEKGEYVSPEVFVTESKFKTSILTSSDESGGTEGTQEEKW